MVIRRFLFTRVCAMLGAGLVVSPAWADTYTWDAGGANTYWSTSANWDHPTLPDTLPGAADDAAFMGGVNRTVSIRAGSQTINNVEISGSANWTFSYNSPDILTCNGLLSYGSSGTSEYQSRLAGSGSLKVAGGILRLTRSDNSYTGTTTVEGGTLRFGGNVPLSVNSALGNAASDIIVGGGDGAADAALIFYYGDYGKTISRTVIVTAGAGKRTIGAISANAYRSTWGPIILSNDVHLVGNDGYATRFSGVISGDHDVIGDSDPARMGILLSANHSYSGATIVKSGTVAWNTDVLVNTDSSVGNGSSAIQIGGGDGSSDASFMCRGYSKTFNRDIVVAAGTGARTLGKGGDGSNPKYTMNGNLTLNKDLRIYHSTDTYGYEWTMAGAVLGNGDLTMELNNQPAKFTGSAVNSFTGKITVVSGTLDLSRNNAIVVPGDLVVGDATGVDKVLVKGAGQFASGTTITLASNAVFDVTAGNYAFANTFKGEGKIVTNTRVITLDPGSWLQPGTNGVGTLTVEDLDFRGGCDFEYDAVTNDLVAAATLTFGGTGVNKSVNVTWLGAGKPSAGDYTLFTYASGADPADVPADWTVNAPAGVKGEVWVDEAGKQVVLTLKSVSGGTMLLLR